MTVLALALGATGCTGSKESPTPTSPSDLTKSATPTPTPSETTKVAPVMPAELQDGKATKANAELFMRYFVDVLNYVRATGDTKPFKRLSASSCALCQNAINSVDMRVAKGGSSQGGVMTIRSLDVIGPVELPTGKSFNQVAQVHVTEELRREKSDSKRVTRYNEHDMTMSIAAMHDQNGWKVLDWDIKDEPS